MSRRTTLTRPSVDRSSTSAYMQARGDSVESEKTQPVGQNPLFSSPPIRGEKRGGPTDGEKGKEKPDSVEQLLSLANKLTASDRKQLLARLALADQGLVDDSRDLDMWVAALQTALVGVARGQDGAGLGFLVLRRLWKPVAVWRSVEEFMDASGLSKLTVPQRQSAYMLLAELLVAYAKQTADYVGAPLTPKFVVNCTPNLGAVFDQAFPGYLAAGLAPIVARRHSQTRETIQ